MIKFFKKIIYFIEYAIILIIFFILSFLPINVVSIMGSYIFKIFGPLTRYHKITLSNLKKILYKTDDELKKIAIESWGNLGKTIFELLILNRVVDQKNNKIKINGKENIDKIIANNDQVIFFGIHQSNWEILVPIIDKLGIRVGAIYRHINNKLIDKLILRKRNQSINTKKSFYTPKGKQSAKEILSAINKNSSMFVVIDQKDSAGEKVKLFDIEVKAQTGFLKIARKYNLKLIPVKVTRYNLNNFLIDFYPAFSPFKKNLSDIDAMLSIHQTIENWILKNPTQWFWQHNRFN